MKERKKQELIFKHYEESLQMLKDWVIKLNQTINDELRGLDKLKANIDND